jgi:hypothetical protein
MLPLIVCPSTAPAFDAIIRRSDGTGGESARRDGTKRPRWRSQRVVQVLAPAFDAPILFANGAGVGGAGVEGDISTIGRGQGVEIVIAPTHDSSV